MDEDINRMLKHLRLGGLLTHWDEYLELATRQRFSHVKLLRHVLEQEVATKHENAKRLRLKRALIPTELELATYPFHLQPKLDRKRLTALYDGFDYMTKAQNIIWMGRPGCGKTGLATGFLIQAINRGHSGRFVTFPSLIQELFASVADHSEADLLQRYQSYDCLLIDELGYIEVEPVQVGLFFTLMEQRHKRKTTLITTNLGFNDWHSFLKNVHLTEALVDRLTETSYIINMKGCRSLRQKLDDEEG